MPIDVQPQLDVSQIGSQVVIEARVAAEPPRPLEWRLTVKTLGPQGSSSTTQGGRTDGSNASVLSTVRVNSAGETELKVLEGGQTIAMARKEFTVSNLSR